MPESTPDPNESRSSFQTEAQRLADAARERAADAFEEIKVSSNQLVDKVRELIEEGNVRRISLRKGERTLFEIPLTVGAGAAAAAVLFNPLLAGIGAVAALVSDITLVIEREDEAGDEAGSKAGGDQSLDQAGSGSTGTAPKGGDAPQGDDGSKTMGRSDAGGGSKSKDDAA